MAEFKMQTAQKDRRITELEANVRERDEALVTEERLRMSFA